jgi:hypothetical protein
VVVNLLLAGVAAVCWIHSSHHRRDDFALDVPRLLLLTNVLWPIYFSEYLVLVHANFVELGSGILLPPFEVCMKAFIVIEFNEPLIGVMYLVSLQPDPRDGLVDRLSPARRRSSFVQGQCLNEGVPGADELALETFCRGVEPHQLLGPGDLLLCSVHCIGRVVPLLGGG